ncbi:LLM class flavin-dependent oxidoreductase [Rhodococcus sp. IEGM 1241]|uniref:LLM class flavin-dependent oxidoreductase n=1 Tax=Rhodococcus sp. IEGM 1241 TaxID=3082228 RepID=UPI002953FBFE|nr:LLM class flavin-dependent oxidoreductase [Rhodococcus sp. IEGM 1241]MDV8015697.1 LLM class flavin-dependent oxidoreductase [Rhodococcus sp. IEGM 1241]
MRGIEIGIRLPPCSSVRNIAEAAAEAEELGFDQVWIPDSQLLWRDPFVTLAACAVGTTSIQLGTAVTNIVTRHTSVLASAARTVAELAPGRLTLGVGTGNSSVQPVGLRASRQSELQEAFSALRALLGGGEYEFNGVRGKLRDPGPALPIYLAASGPKNLQLAGRIADGAILLSGVSPETLTRSAELVKSGADSIGRAADSVVLTVSAYCHVTDDLARDSRRLKPICAGIAQHGGSSALSMAGIDVHVPSRIEGLYPDVIHAEDWDLAVDLCGEWISDEDAIKFAQSFCLFGTAEEIAAGIERVQDAGASKILLQHVGSYDLPYELMNSFAGAVMPRL